MLNNESSLATFRFDAVVNCFLPSEVDAHWNRARALLASEAPRAATASDRRLWDMWPIDAAAETLIRLTRFLRK